jgi:acyl carrier protein
LHELTRNLDLDFFVCFSSIAGVWGSGGHAHYAAANHFLDAFAHYRQAEGLPGTGLSWGPWAGGGMATEQTRSWLERSGVEALPPERAMEILEALLSTKSPHLTVAKVDWQNFQELYEARGPKPLLDRVRVEATGEAGSVAEGESILATLRENPENRSQIIVDHLRREIARIMGHRDFNTLDIERPLLEQGLDSLMAVEIRNLISAAFGETIPVAVLLEGASLENLAEQIESSSVESVSEESAPDRVAAELAPGEAQQLLQNIDQVSDEQVNDLLGSTAEKETESG